MFTHKLRNALYINIIRIYEASREWLWLSSGALRAPFWEQSTLLRVHPSKHICLTVDIIFNEISIYGASMWYARQGFREEPGRVDQDTEFYQSLWKVNFITDK